MTPLARWEETSRISTCWCQTPHRACFCQTVPLCSHPHVTGWSHHARLFSAGASRGCFIEERAKNALCPQRVPRFAVLSLGFLSRRWGRSPFPHPVLCMTGNTVGRLMPPTFESPSPVALLSSRFMHVTVPCTSALSSNNQHASSL